MTTFKNEVDLPTSNIRVFEVKPLTKGSTVPVNQQKSFIRIQFNDESEFIEWAKNIVKSYNGLIERQRAEKPTKSNVKGRWFVL